MNSGQGQKTYLLRNARAISGAQPASYLMGTMLFPPVVKPTTHLDLEPRLRTKGAAKSLTPHDLELERYKKKLLKFHEMWYPQQWGHAVAQLVKALRFKSEGRGFDS